MSSRLFDPVRVGRLTLKNRVVMAPMTRCRATAEHVPTALMAAYYGQRATAGLIVTEGTAPDQNGVGYARIPGLWSDAQVEGWRAVTEAVRSRGGHMSAQLMHTGRVSHPLNMPVQGRVLAPSATRAPGQMYTDQRGPQAFPVAAEMSPEDIEAAIAGFVAAGENAVRAGFDWVELHGANGFLVEQFLCPTTNLRGDAWGGSFARRARFALAVSERLADQIGGHRVGIRLSPLSDFNGIQPWDGVEADYVWLAQMLSELGLAYVHLIDRRAADAPRLPDALKAALRASFSGALILSGGYDQALAAADLEADRADLIAFGRPFVANPDLVERLRQGAPLNEPDEDTFYSSGARGYTDYPTLSAQR